MENFRDEDVDLKAKGDAQELPSPSPVLPIDQDDEIDLCSDELTEILADGPISRVKKAKESEKAVGKNAMDEEEAGGVFELTEWV